MPVGSVAISPVAVTLELGGTQQFTAIVRDASLNPLAGRIVTWSTSDAGVATVTGTGLVTAVADGSSTITATSERRTGSVPVVVRTPVALINVAPITPRMVPGVSEQLTATLRAASGSVLTGRTVTWSTSDAGVATVTSTAGLVTGVGGGNAVITAASEGKTAIAVVTIVPLGTGFGLEQFALIPAGTYQMGSNPAAVPVHSVTISAAFYMQRSEVTQRQWLTMMGINPSAFPACGDTCPVDQVSWDDIQLFLQWLNQSSVGVAYRLPTEAEWEYAARAGTTGETYGPLDAIAWYLPNSGQATHPAGAKQANAWGLYDMIGNVHEWVNDWYAAGYYAVSPAFDPPGAATGTNRVLRGGSWGADALIGSAAFRAFAVPSLRAPTFGFRLVRNR